MDRTVITVIILFFIAGQHLQAVFQFSPKDTVVVRGETVQQQIPDTLIQAQRHVDTQRVALDSAIQSESFRESDSRFWEFISRVDVILGIIAVVVGAMAWLIKRLTPWYHRRPRFYLRTIIQRYEQYEAYVDLKLTAVPDNPGSQPTGAGETLQSAYEILRNKQAIQVLGKPGSGKTTMLNKLLVTYAKQEAHKWSRKIPIYVEYRTTDLFSEMLHFLHVNNFVKDIRYLNEEWLKNQLAKGKFILLIDDLHKMVGTSGQKSESKIQYLIDFPLNKFVLMSKDYLRRSEFGFAVFNVADLSDDQLKRILRLHTSDHNTELIFNHIHWDAKLRALYDTPQILSFLAKAFEKSGRIPLNKSKMFSQFFKMQIDQEEMKGTKSPPELKRRLLEHLALSMLGGQHNPFWIEEQECLSVLNTRLDSLKSEYGYGASSTNDILDELLKSGLVIRDEDGVRFPHDQWQEYFAASEVFRKKIPLESLKYFDSLAELVYFVAGFHTLEGEQKEKQNCKNFLEELIHIDFFLFPKCLKNFQSEE